MAAKGQAEKEILKRWAYDNLETNDYNYISTYITHFQTETLIYSRAKWFSCAATRHLDCDVIAFQAQQFAKTFIMA